MWISPATYAEELEGAQDVEAVRKHLWRYLWQGLHHAQAEPAVVLQRLRGNAWVKITRGRRATPLTMKGAVVGHDPPKRSAV